MKWLLRLYGLVLRVYPRALRERYGADMAASLARLVRRRSSGSVIGIALAVLRGFVDAFVGGVRFRLRPTLSRALLGGADEVEGGSPTIWKKGTGSVVAMVSDIRLALRSVVRQPAFTAMAVFTLVLGIGANVAIFSVVYGLLLRPLPYRDADRLVVAWSANPERGWTRTDVSPGDVWAWYDRTDVFEELAVVGRASLNLTGGDRPERLDAKAVTANFFRVLRAGPILGRGLDEADDRPGAPRVAVLSWSFWQRTFGGDAGVLGRVIRLDGEPHAVVGVLPRDFVYPEGDPDVYVALREVLAEASHADHSGTAIGRLRQGVSIEQASRAVEAVAANLAAELPETNDGWTAYVVSLRSDVLGPIARAAALTLMGAVLFVLLMACVNVANLLLARANGRRREMAVRIALGAGRGRVVRQLLTESLVLALLGGAGGVLLAFGGVRLIAAALPSNMPPVFRLEVDSAVLLFALAVSVFATVLFGLLPAVRSSGASGVELREEGRIGEGRRSRRFGGTLVVAQTALAAILLVGGGIMMRSVLYMQRQDLGYEPQGVLTLRVTLPESSYPDAESLHRFYGPVLERVRALPGVESAGTIQSLPLRGANSVSTFTIAGDATPADGGYPARMGYLSTGYLETMRIRIVRGRGFTGEDRADAPLVALINETLARQRFGTEEPVGRILELYGEPWTIVGVVADMRERAVTRSPEPSIYVPVLQAPTRSRSLAVRTAGDPSAAAQAVQRAIAAVDPDQPVYEVQPMTALIDMRVSPFRLIAGLMLTFALVSLLLGGVGIYGVTAYGVGRRTSEIGIRMAIGAERHTVVRMIVREGMLRAIAGLAIGVALAVPLARAMRSLLVGIGPGDPVTFAGVIALLGAVTFAGAWLPARRAVALDPVRALSHD